MKQFIHFLFILFFAGAYQIHFSFAGSPNLSLHIVARQADFQNSENQNVYKALLKKGIDNVKKAIDLHKKPKKKWITILLLSLLGVFGGHLFYLGYIGKGIARIVMFLSSIIALLLVYLSLTYIFVALFGGSFFIGILLTILAILLVFTAVGLLIWLIVLTIRDLIQIIRNKLLPADDSDYA